MDHNLHATTIALGDWAVALCGPPGAGKSDLALRMLDQGAILVSDDQTLLNPRDGRILASPPVNIAGKLEVRGLGLFDVPYRSAVPLGLVVDLRPQAEIERLPETAYRELCGVPVRAIALDPGGLSAPQKLRLALREEAALIMCASADPREEVGGAVSDEASRRVGRPEGDGLRLIVVTGMSGAGRSTALRMLEDQGFESIDNLPLSLLDAVVGEVGLMRPIAVGVDIRTRDFAVKPVLDQLDALAGNPSFATTLLFVDCEDEVLERRFTETRRRHPLAKDRPLADGIAAERRLVAPLRERADLMIDSSRLTPADFRSQLLGHVGAGSGGAMTVFVTSFSYRQGLPREADLVFDVRFLANPHYDPSLRPLSGRDATVADYVSRDPDFEPFFDHLKDMLAPLLPRYEREGKSYLTIAIGCTGGRHRSVFTAERLAAWLGAEGQRVHLGHRDIARDPQRAAGKP